MYSFVDQLAEEQVDIPCVFLLDDIAGVHDLPKYDEYDGDYFVDFGVDFLEQPSTCSSLGSVQFQQSDESTKLIYDSYNIEYDENCEFTEGNSLPLCFSSFEFLKKKIEIITE